MLLLLLQFIGCYGFPYVLPFMGLIVLFLVTVYWMLPFVLSSMASDFGLLFATVYRTLFFFLPVVCPVWGLMVYTLLQFTGCYVSSV